MIKLLTGGVSTDNLCALQKVYISSRFMMPLLGISEGDTVTSAPAPTVTFCSLMWPHQSVSVLTTAETNDLYMADDQLTAVSKCSTRGTMQEDKIDVSMNSLLVELVP